LKLKHDKLPSNVAFNCNLRPSTLALVPPGSWINEHVVAKCESLRRTTPNLPAPSPSPAGHHTGRTTPTTPTPTPAAAAPSYNHTPLTSGHKDHSRHGAAHAAAHPDAADADDDVRWEAVVRYADDTTGGELPQLLNVIFGNSSIKVGGAAG